MSDLNALKEAVAKWRGQAVGDYHISVSFIGAAIHRMGDHDLNYVDGEFYHYWEGSWRKLDKDSDFWLFSVPGALVWVRDMIVKVGVSDETLQVEYDDEYGYVKRLRVQMASRDQHNFTYEVRQFGLGPDEGFEK